MSGTNARKIRGYRATVAGPAGGDGANVMGAHIRATA